VLAELLEERLDVIGKLRRGIRNAGEAELPLNVAVELLEQALARAEE
jgi:hypothetical protein